VVSDTDTKGVNRAIKIKTGRSAQATAGGEGSRPVKRGACVARLGLACYEVVRPPATRFDCGP
jgi:hypothetical protein